MKSKINKIINNGKIKIVIGFIIGIIISSIGAYATGYLYDSDEVGYNNSKTGLSANNVQDAIEEIYSESIYTITFNSNGGTGSMDSKRCAYGYDCELPVNTFTRDNYNFMGWAESADGDVLYEDEETVVDIITNTTNGNKTLYAVWMIEYTITNLVKNGSFENTGWNNCTYDTSEKKFGSYSCKMTASSSDFEKFSQSSVSMYLYSTHIYYALIYSKSTISSGIAMYWPITEPGISFNRSAQTTWEKSSVIFTRSTFSNGNKSYRIDFDNNYQSGTVYYDGLAVIDLTEAFGAGNEPTKEWCDENIDYFDGTMIVYK